MVRCRWWLVRWGQRAPGEDQPPTTFKRPNQVVSYDIFLIFSFISVPGVNIRSPGFN